MTAVMILSFQGRAKICILCIGCSWDDALRLKLMLLWTLW